MKTILESLNTEKEISFAYGHNDFTPWNMFIENNNGSITQMSTADIIDLFK